MCLRSLFQEPLSFHQQQVSNLEPSHQFSLIQLSLREKCPYSEFLWSVFSQNARKYETEKFRIRTLFTQCITSGSKTFLSSFLCCTASHLSEICIGENIWQSLVGHPFKKKNSSRSSRPEMFYKKDVLRNFTKFTGKHLCQSLFFNKVAGPRTCFFIGHLWWLLLQFIIISIIHYFNGKD